MCFRAVAVRLNFQSKSLLSTNHKDPLPIIIKNSTVYQYTCGYNQRYVGEQVGGCKRALSNIYHEPRYLCQAVGGELVSSSSKTTESDPRNLQQPIANTTSGATSSGRNMASGATASTASGATSSGRLPRRSAPCCKPTDGAATL